MLTATTSPGRPHVQPGGRRARRLGRSRARYLGGLGLAVVALLAAACGSSQPSPTAGQTGLTSIAPPATAGPLASDTATPAIGASPSPSLSPGASAGPSTGPSPTPIAIRTPLPSVKIGLTRVASGLSAPIGIASAGDSRLFVIEQSGKVVILRGGTVAGTFLDISARVSCCGERGLLGLAFHPNYASNGRFFVRYTNPAGNVVISEFHVSSNPGQADAASEKILLTIPHPTYANHNGGRIEFGPDGYLYIGTGDGGSGGDPNGHGQSLATLLGKMLRIDVNQTSSGLAYAIPASNPFAGQSGRRGEIWSYGLRNPYSFSFDRRTGDLWIGDVGQNLWEEVDRATAASGGGRGINYGWNRMEGNHCYNPASGCNTAGIARPIAEYGHGTNDSIGCSIIGGYVYRGTAHPELTGRYFFSDYCSGSIWDVAAAGPASQTPQLLLSSGLRAVGWGQDVTGELYLVAQNGSVYRLG